MDLSGAWHTITADDDLRRQGIGLDVDDSTWPELDVPGHWRSDPTWAHSDGPLLYRRRFELGVPEPGRRRWITFEGIFYQADVWLDGAYLGDPEGYFFPHSFDITALSRLGEDHVVAVEVTCSPEQGTRARRNITGILQHSEAVDWDWNPGGLWRPVLVYDTGPVKLDRLRVLCRDADETRAHLRLYARLESDVARTIRLRTNADGTAVGETEHAVAAGTNEIEWTLDVDQPRLWWPRALGGQPMTDIVVEVMADGDVSDRRSRRTGLREVAWNEWVCSINGERVFLKGANVLPTRPGLADAKPDEVRHDVELAIEANLDVLRVQAHIAHPELYRAADELGMLLMQDFPLQWGYDRSIRREAVRQAREAVNALGHHPSIVQWCAHDEPIADAPALDGVGRRVKLRRLIGQQLPTWNKTVLDRWVKRAFEQSDTTRPVVAHRGVLPHFPQLEGSDTHMWLGWHHGQAAELAALARLMPRLVRFLGEFGAQSVPEDAESFAGTADFPDLDWEALARHHGVEAEVMRNCIPVELHSTFGSWRRASQVHQASVLRDHIEILRRLKYSPTGGFTFSWLADPGPLISTSVLDHERRPKLAWQAVVDACRPVIVVADPLPQELDPGDLLGLDLHVVNDLRVPVVNASVAVTATWPSGRHRWMFRGEIAADACELVGRIELDVPEGPGELLLGIALTGHDADGVQVSSRRRRGARIRS